MPFVRSEKRFRHLVTHLHKAIKIEPLDIRFLYKQEYKFYHDFLNYEITYGNVSLTFRIAFVDASTVSIHRS